MAEKNRLRTIRISEGLTITELSRLANVSTKVISQTERLLRNPTLVTKHKILKGLNLSSGNLKYSLEEIFPDDASD